MSIDGSTEVEIHHVIKKDKGFENTLWDFSSAMSTAIEQYRDVLYFASEQASENEVLKEQLKEAQEVIDFYANEKYWLYPGNDFHNFAIAKSDTDRVVRSNTKDTVSCGGRRARAFNKKYSR